MPELSTPLAALHEAAGKGDLLHRFVEQVVTQIDAGCDGFAWMSHMLWHVCDAAESTAQCNADGGGTPANGTSRCAEATATTAAKGWIALVKESERGLGMPPS